MAQFMAGRIRPEQKQETLIPDGTPSLVPTAPLEFSPAAQLVMQAGLALWRYYHAQPDANPNASYYDIREHFQGRDAASRMNNASPNEEYTALISALREAHQALAEEIELKVYEYGFLR